jgi:hypothetical protein
MMYNCPERHLLHEWQQQLSNCNGPVPSAVAVKPQPNWSAISLAELIQGGVNVPEKLRRCRVHRHVELQSAVEATTQAVSWVVQFPDVPRRIN